WTFCLPNDTKRLSSDDGVGLQFSSPTDVKLPPFWLTSMNPLRRSVFVDLLLTMISVIICSAFISTRIQCGSFSEPPSHLLCQKGEAPSTKIAPGVPCD